MPVDDASSDTSEESIDARIGLPNVRVGANAPSRPVLRRAARPTPLVPRDTGSIDSDSESEAEEDELERRQYTAEELEQDESIEEVPKRVPVPFPADEEVYGDLPLRGDVTAWCFMCAHRQTDSEDFVNMRGIASDEEYARTDPVSIAKRLLAYYNKYVRNYLVDLDDNPIPPRDWTLASALAHVTSHARSAHKSLTDDIRVLTHAKDMLRLNGLCQRDHEGNVTLTPGALKMYTDASRATLLLVRERKRLSGAAAVSSTTKKRSPKRRRF
jgi:hypothetical protein